MLLLVCFLLYANILQVSVHPWDKLRNSIPLPDGPATLFEEDVGTNNSHPQDASPQNLGGKLEVHTSPTCRAFSEIGLITHTCC